MKRLTCLCLVSVFLAVASALRAESIEWMRQFGTSSDERSHGVSADGLGGVYITGYTAGSLGGPFAGGITDAFLSKFDAAGTLQWSRQLGTSSSYDISYGVSADGIGNVYISGSTDGSLSGQNAGSYDAFVSKYDAIGTLQWTRQLGTNQGDESYGVSADGLGNVYISGFTRGSLGGPNAGNDDAFVSKYDSAGNRIWTRQIGTSSNEGSRGVSADGLGSVYITGYTAGSLGEPFAGGNGDVFISKYDAAGVLQWTRQLGSSAGDYGAGISADGLGNVYVSGQTDGSLGGPFAGGSGDVFVSKYDAAGALEWTRQLGTSADDIGLGVSADDLGNVYISGLTRGGLGGPNAGASDAFVCKLDATGTLQWSQQLGTSTSDWNEGVSADGLDSVYISGTTQGSLGQPSAGREDVFVAKIGNLVLAGDFDFDDDVDGRDFLIWQRGGSPNPSRAGDLADWQANYGVDPMVAANLTVPEPSALMLVALAAVGMLAVRERPVRETVGRKEPATQIL